VTEAHVDKSSKFETIVKVEQKSGNEVGLKSLYNIYSLNGNFSMIIVIVFMIATQ